MADSESVPVSSRFAWNVFQRLQEVGAEQKTAWIRLGAVIVFYAIHLFTYLGTDISSAAHVIYHWRITLVCGLWSLVSVAVFICVARRYMPAWVKFLTSGADVLLLTAAALLNVGGNSYEVILFPIIVAATTLRFSPALVSFTTAMAVAGYLMLVGTTDRKWFDSNHQVPTVNLLITITCIALAGVIAWQTIRQVQKMFPETLIAKQGASHHD